MVIPVPAGLTTVRVGVNHGGGVVFAGLTTNPAATCSGGAVVAPNAYNGSDLTVVNNTVTIYACGASTFVAYTETSGGG